MGESWNEGFWGTRPGGTHKMLVLRNPISILKASRNVFCGRFDVPGGSPLALIGNVSRMQSNGKLDQYTGHQLRTFSIAVCHPGFHGL